MTSFQKGIKIFALTLGILITVSICTSLLGLVGLFSSFDDYDIYHDHYKGDNNYNNTETLDDFRNITSLDIDLSSTQLEIYEADEFKIEKHGVKEEIRVSNHNGKVTILERNKTFWKFHSGGTIVVFVPKKMDNIDIKVDAGKITLEGIEAEYFDLDQGAGKAQIVRCNFENTDIDGGAGKIEIKDSTVNNLDLDSGVGSVDIKARILGNSEIDADVGSLRLTLLGNKEEYMIRAKKGLGSIRIEGENGEGTYGHGENIINIEGGIGSISVDFRDR